MTGKEKCKKLKRFRNILAKANGIDFKSKECDFEGECPGYCPACDEEILFLEKELQKVEQGGQVLKMQGLLMLAFKNGDTIHEYTSAFCPNATLGRLTVQESDKEDDATENKDGADAFKTTMDNIVPSKKNKPTDDDETGPFLLGWIEDNKW